MRLRTFLKPLSFIPALLLMYMIFSFSSQNGTVSSDLSHRVSRKIVVVADQILDKGLEDWKIEEYANRIEGITRKCAHMLEYFALAVAVAFPLYVYGLHGIALMLAAGLFCVAFACTDEYHQSFVAGRGPSVKDVLIDSFGVFWGIILVRIVGWTGRKTVFRPKPRPRREKRAYPTPGEPEVYGYSGQRPVTPGYAYGQPPVQPRSGQPVYPGAYAPRPFPQNPGQHPQDAGAFQGPPVQRRSADLGQGMMYDCSVPPRQDMDDLPDETFPMPTRRRQ